MTLPASGALGFAQVNAEIGAAARTPMSLGWVRTNSYYAYHNLGSIHGLTWFAPLSSQNSITRTVNQTVTNCVNAVATVQGNPSHFRGILTNCVKRVVTNCDQCAYNHGTQLQANCNCNCNCSACNCNYTACAPVVVNCNNNCNNTCYGGGTCATCANCTCHCNNCACGD